MPKAILEFHLPEDQESFEKAICAENMSSFIFEFGEWLSRKYKHADPPSDDAYDEYDEIRNKFFEAKNEHNLTKV